MTAEETMSYEAEIKGLTAKVESQKKMIESLRLKTQLDMAEIVRLRREIESLKIMLDNALEQLKRKNKVNQ